MRRPGHEWRRRSAVRARSCQSLTTQNREERSAMAAGLAAFRDHDFHSGLLKRDRLVDGRCGSGEQHPSLPYRGDRFRRDDAKREAEHGRATVEGGGKLIRKRIRRPLRRGWNGKAKLGEDRCDAVERCACVALVIDGVPWANRLIPNG